MQMGKQQIKCLPIIVTKLNPPQPVAIDNNEDKSLADLKILDFKDFPKIKLKGKYKKQDQDKVKKQYGNDVAGDKNILIQSWAADEEEGNSPMV